MCTRMPLKSKGSQISPTQNQQILVVTVAGRGGWDCPNVDERGRQGGFYRFVCGYAYLHSIKQQQHCIVGDQSCVQCEIHCPWSYVIFHDSASLAREYMHTYIILTWNLKNEHLEEEIPF